MLDVSPQSQISDSTGRRVSRLPPGVQMLDPFGFSLAAEASPYDLALKASSAPVTPGILTPSRSPVRSSFLQPHLTTTSGPSSSNGHSQIASSSSIGSNLSNASTTATSPTIQPWTKPRASSAGEVYQLNSRAQIKSGLLGPPQIQRGGSSRSRLSKLSGEIDAEVRLLLPSQYSLSRAAETDVVPSLERRQCRSLQQPQNSNYQLSFPPIQIISIRSYMLEQSKRRKHSRRNGKRPQQRGKCLVMIQKRQSQLRHSWFHDHRWIQVGLRVSSV